MNHDFGAIGDLVCGAGAALGVRQFWLLAKCNLQVCHERGPIVRSSAAVGTPVVTVFGSGFLEWFAAGRDGHRIVFRRIYMGIATLFAVDHQTQVMDVVTEMVKSIAPVRASIAEAYQ